MSIVGIELLPSTDRHRRYVVVETMVSIGISALLSAAFAWVIFGHAVPVAAGNTAFRIDAMIQALIVAFMSAVVPSLLLGRRMKSGLILRAGSRAAWWPNHLVLRSALLAAIVAAPATAAHLGATFFMLDHHFSLAGLLVWKAVYGSIIAAVSTGTALRLMLAQPVGLKPEGVS